MSNKAIKARERRQELAWIIGKRNIPIDEDTARRFVSGTRAIIRQDLEYLRDRGLVELEWFIHWDGEEERQRYLIRATSALLATVLPASASKP